MSGEQRSNGSARRRDRRFRFLGKPGGVDKRNKRARAAARREGRDGGGNTSRENSEGNSAHQVARSEWGAAAATNQVRTVQYTSYLPACHTTNALAGQQLCPLDMRSSYRLLCTVMIAPLHSVPSPSWDSTAHHGMNCLLPCLLHWSCDACRHLAAIRLRTTASSHYTENVLSGHAHREGRLSELVHGAEIHLAQSRNRYLGYLEYYVVRTYAS